MIGCAIVHSNQTQARIHAHIRSQGTQRSLVGNMHTHSQANKQPNHAQGTSTTTFVGLLATSALTSALSDTQKSGSRSTTGKAMGTQSVRTMSFVSSEPSLRRRALCSTLCTLGRPCSTLLSWQSPVQTSEYFSAFVNCFSALYPNPICDPRSRMCNVFCTCA
jgi:hypothetical protein